MRKTILVIFFSITINASQVNFQLPSEQDICLLLSKTKHPQLANEIDPILSLSDKILFPKISIDKLNFFHAFERQCSYGSYAGTGLYLPYDSKLINIRALSHILSSIKKKNDLLYLPSQDFFEKLKKREWLALN